MSDYKKLVAELKQCSNGIVQCDGCSYAGKTWDWGCEAALMDDAAAAIEELQAEVDRLTKENRELAADRPEMEEVNGHWEWKNPNYEQHMPKRGDLVEVVRCKDCDSWDTEHSSGRKSLGNFVCICQEWSDGEDARWVYTGEDEFCSRGERRAKMEVHG